MKSRAYMKSSAILSTVRANKDFFSGTPSRVIPRPDQSFEPIAGRSYTRGPNTYAGLTHDVGLEGNAIRDGT